MIYIDSKDTVVSYDAPEIIETAIHTLLVHMDEVDVGVGYDEDELTRPAYEQGLTDAWELAKKVVLPVRPHSRTFTAQDLNNIFGIDGYENVLSQCSASEAIAKFQKYEEEQKNADVELKVGDEIEIRAESSIPKMVVTQIDNQYISTVDAKGDTRCICKNTTTFVKTGRHFPQIEEMLKQMKGES